MAEIARFTDPWEAELARHLLADAGIEAWVESSVLEFRVHGERRGRVRLLVPGDQADEARAVLAEAREADAARPARPRPVWVGPVAAVVALGLIAVAIPRILWPWLIVIALVGLLLWATLRPAPPGR